MVESYVVQNVSPGPISFSVFASYVIPEGTPKHKRRKMTKGAAQSIVIPPQQSMDLVAVTGLSVADLKGQPELNKILYNRVTRLRLLYAPKTPAEESVVEPKVEEPEVEASPVGEPPVTEPVVEEPVVEEPKADMSKKKNKKKKKK